MVCALEETRRTELSSGNGRSMHRGA